MPSAVLNDWVEGWSAGKVPATTYRKFLQTHAPAEMNSVQLANHPDNFMYVLRTDGSLVIQIKQRGKANHTSLSGGQAVLAAGHIHIVDGKITAIDTSSGHYRPSLTQIMSMLEVLQKSGVAVNEIIVSYATRTNQDGLPDMDQIPRGKAEEWMQAKKERLIDELEKLAPINREQAKNLPYAKLEQMISNIQKSSR